MQVSFANICFIINICIIPYMHFQHYSLRNKILFKISFQCSLKLFGQKVPWNFLQSSMELFEQHLGFLNSKWFFEQQMVFNCAGWIDFHKLINTITFCKSLSPTYVLLSIFALYLICISNINHYVTKYHSKSLFNAHWNFLVKKFHGTFSKVPWNFLNNIWTTSVVPWNSMEFHGILSRSKVPWNSMELFPHSRVPWNSMELFLKFHGIPWNSMELDKFHI